MGLCGPGQQPPTPARAHRLLTDALDGAGLLATTGTDRPRSEYRAGPHGTPPDRLDRGAVAGAKGSWKSSGHSLARTAIARTLHSQRPAVLLAARRPGRNRQHRHDPWPGHPFHLPAGRSGADAAHLAGRVAGFGLLLGALAIRVNRIGAVFHVLQGIVLFPNGAFVPIGLFAGWLQVAARLLPTTRGVGSAGRPSFREVRWPQRGRTTADLVTGAQHGDADRGSRRLPACHSRGAAGGEAGSEMSALAQPVSRAPSRRTLERALSPARSARRCRKASSTPGASACRS